MKYVIKREEFVKRLNESIDKEQVINEVMTNDIGWGDSLVGRLFSSIFRMAKMSIDTKRIDFHLSRLQSVSENSIINSTSAKEAIKELKSEAKSVAIANSLIDVAKSNPLALPVAFANISDTQGQESAIQALSLLPESTQSVMLSLITNVISADGTASTSNSATVSQTSDKPEVSGPTDKDDIDKIQKIKNAIESLKKIIADKKAKGEDTSNDENQLKNAENGLKATLDKIAKNKAEKESTQGVNTNNENPARTEESYSVELSNICIILEKISISLGVKINEEFDNIRTNNILDAFRKQINKEVKEISVEDAKKELPNIVGELDKFSKESTDKIAKEANETGKKYETEIKNTKKILTDPIEILRIFNDVNRIIVRGNIPSGRTGGKVTNSRANNWEKLDGSGVNADSPGPGPFRNIKLFSKWNDGVLALMKDKQLEGFFNSKWIIVDGEEKKVDYSITSFITDMLNDQQAFGKPGYQKTYLEKHFGVKGVAFDKKIPNAGSASATTDNVEDEKKDDKEWVFVESNEDISIPVFADKKCFRVKCTYRIDGKEKEGYVYFVGYNNVLENNEVINKDIFKGSKLFQVSLDNDYYLSQYKGSTYKAKSSVDLNKKIYSVIVNNKDIAKEGSYNLYALPPVKRDVMKDTDAIALDIKKVITIEVLSKEDKPVTMNVSISDKDNQLKKAEKWFPYTQKETIQIMYDKFSKMKGFRN